MEWKQLTIDALEQISGILEKALEGLTHDDLNQQPKPDCNSIGWLTWHLTRAQDRSLAELMGAEQLWIKDNWYTKFNRPPDPEDWGFGHSPEDLAAFKSPDSQTLLAYHRVVLKRSKHYISDLSEDDLDRAIDHPRFPTVAAQVVGLIANLQHAGQVAYVRGFLKGLGWAK
ncbi:DinB family protein [Chloroflexota bacterium]